MKRLFGFLIILFFYQTGFSQYTSTTGEAMAFLVVPLSIQGTGGDIDFGEIILTGNSMTYTIPPPQGKQFLVTGHPNTMISINYSSTTLDNSEWVNTFGGTIGNLTFQPNVIIPVSTPVIPGDSYQLNTSGELQLNVGGSITIASDQPQGDYVGLFEITVSY